MVLPIRGGGAAGGDIGESVFATCTTLLEKLPAPWTDPESHDLLIQKDPVIFKIYEHLTKVLFMEELWRNKQSGRVEIDKAL